MRHCKQVEMLPHHSDSDDIIAAIESANADRLVYTCHFLLTFYTIIQLQVVSNL